MHWYKRCNCAHKSKQLHPGPTNLCSASISRVMYALQRTVRAPVHKQHRSGTHMRQHGPKDQHFRSTR